MDQLFGLQHRGTVPVSFGGALEQENTNINIKNRTIMKKMMNWVLAAILI